MSVARFIADQRTFYLVPYAFCCRLLGVSESWLYKWIDREPTARQKRREQVDAAVRKAFDASKRVHGSPRLRADLLAEGWKVSEKTIADSMRRQGLVARIIKRRRGLTVQDRKAPKFPDLLERDFSACMPNSKWCGDITEIPTQSGKLYLATVIDLYSRRLLGAATSLHPNAELAADAIRIAAATRGGRTVIEGVIFHTDRGSTRGFNWSSQHLDDGGVVRWQDADSSVPIERSGQACGLRVGHRLGGRSNGSFGGASPRATPARTLRPQWACRSRWARAGFATVAACHRSVLSSPRAGTCRSSNARRSRC